MRRSSSFSSILVALAVVGGAACAHAGRAASVASVSTTPQSSATSAAQSQNFITVEGADLNAKLASATARARSTNAHTTYWSAYAFDVRPGVAVDPGGGEFHGSMNNSGNTTVFVGTSNGMTVETRNLGVFLLRDANSSAISRVEIYNLDRKREYGGYPVYWMGRAGNDESLNFLRTLAEAAPAATRNGGLINEHAALAVALHDDARVAAMLKTFVRSSQNMSVRSTAVYWLGQVGGETQFLADLVRNESEKTDIRRQAAHAIGASRDRAALTTLQGLYDGLPQTTPGQRDVKRGIIHAVSDNENKDAATAFLLKVAKTDADNESRRTAVHALAEEGRDAVIDDLMSI
ncbi:MAG TPA: HEAT repeat domain-containing protein, partial [Pyrinomonadaceae bacterium]|nr:HEAT repeat domain-containing protein [Pyrinomonadaceae bacterium]